MVGELTIREWTDRDNNRRTSREITATHVGASLRYLPKTTG